MADLNIRNIPKELIAQNKAEAAMTGKTLRELVLEKLGIRSVVIPELESPKRAVGKNKLETIAETCRSLVDNGVLKPLDEHFSKTSEKEPEYCKRHRMINCERCR